LRRVEGKFQKWKNDFCSFRNNYLRGDARGLLESKLSVEELAKLAEKIGLTGYEARAYVALLLHGPLTATELARRGEIPQPRVYDVTKSLEEKGLILISEGRPKKFTVIDPGAALKRLIEKKYQEELSSIRELIEQASLAGRVLEEPGVWTASGVDAVENVVLSSLRHARNELLISGFSDFLENYLSGMRLENLSSCLVLYDENYSRFAGLFDEVRVRPTRAPQFVIPDFSMVVAVVSWETRKPVVYKVTDRTLMKIFAVYYLSYLRGGSRVVSSRFDKLSRRTYHHLTRALEHLRVAEQAGRRITVTVKGRWTRSGENALLSGIPVQVFENSYKGIGTLVLETSDGKRVSIGGIDAYLEDVEGLEITIEAT
jgi:DNA-binding MarR family transcriptional regulator